MARGRYARLWKLSTMRCTKHGAPFLKATAVWGTLQRVSLSTTGSTVPNSQSGSARQSRCK
eukprot:362117-Alexandrium_andersonii.AAC.1